MGQISFVLSSSIAGIANMVSSPAHLPSLLSVYQHFRGEGLIFLVKFDVGNLDLWVTRCINPCVYVVGECQPMRFHQLLFLGFYLLTKFVD